MINFGVPRRLAAFSSIALPLVELSAALALLTSGWAWWSAIVTFGLLVTFVAAIAVNLAHGRTPECHCFGQMHSGPIGWSTLARNIVLAGGPAWLVLQGPRHDVSAFNWLIALVSEYASISLRSELLHARSALVAGFSCI
jgi:prepilin signal peptidase PulO-like enzyme (type II secretory pathway)